MMANLQEQPLVSKRIRPADIRRDGYIVIKSKACSVVRVSMFRRQGVKYHVTGTDIFTGEKLEDTLSSSVSCEVPNISSTQYQLIDISDTGAVTLLSEDGSIKNDLELPTDKTLAAQIKDGFADGKDVLVSVLSWGSKQKISAVKDIGSKY